MPDSVPLLVIIAAIVTAIILVSWLVAQLRHLIVFGQPDEWLLKIRNGKLLRAGIGLTILRLPGDQIVRFTSTLQRVVFRVEAYTKEHTPVTIEGFALWSVLTQGEGPFRAYRTLGLANLQRPPTDLRSPRHLLGAQQYRAFQTLFGACVQRLSSRRALWSLLDEQDDLLHALEACVTEDADELGIHIEQVQILSVQPTEPAMLEQLGAAQEAELREQAKKVRLETDERLEQMGIASQTNVAQQRAQSELDRESFALQNAVTLERRKLAAARERAELEGERLGVDRDSRVAEIAMKAAIDQAQAERELQAQRGEDAALQERGEADLQRQRDELRLEVEQIRQRAAARHDAIVSVTQAEEEKSPAVREQQLVELVATKVTEAMVALPVKDVHWTTWSADTPMAGLGHAITELRQVLGGGGSPPSATQH